MRHPRLCAWLLPGILDGLYWLSDLIITDPRKRDLVAKLIIWSMVPSVWFIRNWFNRASRTRIAYVKATSQDAVSWRAWLRKRRYTSRWPPSLRVYMLVFVGALVAYTNMVYIASPHLRIAVSCGLTVVGYSIVWCFGRWLDAANRTAMLCVETRQQAIIPVSSH